MEVILLVIILAVLVLSHEFGHFIVAKLSGVEVEEFGLGLPPRAWGKKIGETIYSLNWIPFGGFVRIFGEDATEQDLKGPRAKRAFPNKPLYIQAAIIVSGVIFNIILAVLLLWFGLQAGLPVSLEDFPTHISQITNQSVLVTGVMPGSPADLAHVPTGARIKNFKTPQEIQNVVKYNEGKMITLVTDKGNFDLVPAPILGIQMDLVGNAHFGPIYSIPQSVRLVYALTKETAIGLASFVGNIFRGHASLSGVVGPVGIAGIVGAAASQGFGALLLVTVILSLSLAVINLVPFPALDGGRLLFVIIESVKGSPIKAKVANTINLVGFSLLILLMVVITYKDIVRLVHG